MDTKMRLALTTTLQFLSNFRGENARHELDSLRRRVYSALYFTEPPYVYSDGCIFAGTEEAVDKRWAGDKTAAKRIALMDRDEDLTMPVERDSNASS